MSKIIDWFVAFLRRVLYAALMMILWSTYPVVIFAYWGFCSTFLVFVLPVVWLFLGTEAAKSVWYFLTMHKNSKWWVNIDLCAELDGEFQSFTPRYPYPISDYLCDVLLKR